MEFICACSDCVEGLGFRSVRIMSLYELMEVDKSELW